MAEPEGRNLLQMKLQSNEKAEKPAGRNLIRMQEGPSHVGGFRLPTQEDFSGAETRQTAQEVEFEAELERMGQRIIDQRSNDPEWIGWTPGSKTPAELAATKLGRLEGSMMSWGDELYGIIDSDAGKHRSALKKYAEKKYGDKFRYGEGAGATFNAVATLPFGVKGADKVVSAIPKIGNTAKAAGTGATSALGWDAIDQLGAGDGDLTDRVESMDPVRSTVAAGTGALLGAGISKAGEGVQSLVEKRAAPSLDELGELRKQAYKDAEDLGVEYSPEKFSDLVATIEMALDDMEVEPLLNTKILGVLKRLQGRVTDAPLSMARLDKIRQAVRKQTMGRGADDQDQMFGQLVIDEIDKFIDEGASVVPGLGKVGAEAMKKARSLHKIFKKTELLEQAYEKAAINAEVTGSGGNFENRLRQEMRKIFTNKKLSASFSEPELKLMRAVMSGAPIQKALRAYGKMDPFSHGIASMFAAGNIGGIVSGHLNPVTGALWAGAIPARIIGEKLASGKFGKLDTAVRSAAAEFMPGGQGGATAVGGGVGGTGAARAADPIAEAMQRQPRTLQQGVEGVASQPASDPVAPGPTPAPQRPTFGKRQPEVDPIAEAMIDQGDDPVSNGIPRLFSGKKLTNTDPATKTVAEMFKEGFTVEDIASELNFTTEGVEKHLKTALRYGFDIGQNSRAGPRPAGNGLPLRSKPGRDAQPVNTGEPARKIKMQFKDGRPTVIGKVYEFASSVNPETGARYTSAEIADEMAMSNNQVAVTLNRLRANGFDVDVPASASPTGANGEKRAMAVELKRQGLGEAEILSRVNAVYGKDAVHGGTDMTNNSLRSILSKARRRLRDSGDVVDFGVGVMPLGAAAGMNALPRDEQSIPEHMLNESGTIDEQLLRAMMGGM